jgi:hypothetical protein
MPNINTMMPSKYLKKEDVPQPALVTIRSFTRDNVAQQNEPEERKWIMHFDEFPVGMVLNSTNLQLAAQAMGSDETDDWIGKKIVIYTDPNVSFGGKLIGGLRLRAPRKNKPAPPPPPVEVEDDLDSDIPF